MVCKPLANQMRVRVDGTENLRYTVHEWFAYHLPQTKICRFFARTQRELNAPGVLSTHRVFLCSPQVRGKLINRTLLTRRMWTAQRVSGAFVYTKLYIPCMDWYNRTLARRGGPLDWSLGRKRRQMIKVWQITYCPSCKG